VETTPLTFRVGLQLGAVVIRPAHLDLDQRAHDAASVFGQMASAQNLQGGGKYLIITTTTTATG